MWRRLSLRHNSKGCLRVRDDQLDLWPTYPATRDDPKSNVKWPERITWSLQLPPASLQKDESHGISCCNNCVCYIYICLQVYEYERSCTCVIIVSSLCGGGCLTGNIRYLRMTDAVSLQTGDRLLNQSISQSISFQMPSNRNSPATTCPMLYL